MKETSPSVMPRFEGEGISESRESLIPGGEDESPGKSGCEKRRSDHAIREERRREMSACSAKGSDEK
jgi:hypothetical protein